VKDSPKELSMIYNASNQPIFSHWMLVMGEVSFNLIGKNPSSYRQQREIPGLRQEGGWSWLN